MKLIDEDDRPKSLFGSLSPQAPDALLALIALARDDRRAAKVDLGVGVYRNDEGCTPVMSAVKKAERVLLGDQDTKSYLGPEGDIHFVQLLEPIVFGSMLDDDARMTGVQAPGGTGALRLALDLTARASPAATVWVGEPTWPNHMPIVQSAHLRVRCHPFFDVAAQAVEFEAMMSSLDAVQQGDVVLLHGCCHNPTGANLDFEKWAALASLLSKQGAVPLVDLAYQGLGRGLDEDAEGLRIVLAACPEAMVAYSCDKNFGLYRERVGALWVRAADAKAAIRARENLLALARAAWSMPPDHGAAVVRTVLAQPGLRREWLAELDAMRIRLTAIRDGLSSQASVLAPIASGTGMFATLPLSVTAVEALRRDHAIHVAGSGRINIAGLRLDDVPRVARALASHLHKES